MRLSNTSRRPATITVIVVAFLGLFLIMGLSFAFYGLREAEESKVYRDAQNGGQAGSRFINRGGSTSEQPPEPEAIANKALASVIFGPSDDVNGAFNSLRQHDMARGVYGWNPKFPSPYWGYNIPQPATFNPNQAAIHPFNGLGRVSPAAVVGPNCLPPNGNLPANMINYEWIPPSEYALNPGLAPILGGMMYNASDNYARDPSVTNLIPWSYTPAAPGTPGDRYWAPNADYTYPDDNNFFLAAIDPTSGRVLIPSYHRPWLVGSMPPPANPDVGPIAGLAYNPADTNPWTNSTGRLSMLRPRPVDHQWPRGSGLSEWRYPSTNPDGSYGDVENLEGKAGGRQFDSMWVDIGLPVATKHGKSYKPLVAMLIVDLDGRVNVNTAGNFYPDPNNPGSYIHGSNQGFGPWEVNLGKVMKIYQNPPAMPSQFDDTFGAYQIGSAPPGGSGLAAHGRFGLTWLNGNPLQVPVKQYVTRAGQFFSPNGPLAQGGNMPPSGSAAHFYSGVDYNGRYGVGVFSADDPLGHTTGFTFGPGFDGAITPPDPNNQPRPNGNSRFDGGFYVTDGSGNPYYDERSHHSSLYNPYLLRTRPWQNLSVVANRVIPNRAFGPEEMRLLNGKYNYDLSSLTRSELAQLAPNTLGNAAYRGGQLNSRFAITTTSNDFDLPGASPWLGGPNAYQMNPPAQAGQPQSPPQGSPIPLDPFMAASGNGDHDDSFRSRMNTVMGPVDLTRKLTDYRADLTRPLGATNVGNTARAIGDRQQLAADILKRLRFVVGLDPTGTTPPGSGNETDRWLAQLAVNMVDFIDSDECITPFKWTSANGAGGDDLSNEMTGQLTTFKTTVQNDWVFGFERPRVTINETYIRVENDPNDSLMDNANQWQAQMDYNMLMWLELHNPLTPATPGDQFAGNEGYMVAPTPVPDDLHHGGYRALLKDTFSGSEKSVYRVLVTKVTANAGGPPNADPMGMLPASPRNNVAGVPTSQIIKTVTFDNTNMSVVDGSNMGTPISIQPNVGAQYRPSAPNNSFFLVGPQLDQQMGMGAAQIPGAQANLTTTQLQERVNMMTEFTNADPTNNTPGRPTWWPGFVLQRLTCPAMPPGPTNPYITVDYWESDLTAINNRLKVDNGRQPGGNTAQGTLGQTPEWNDSFSFGRRQPYDGVVLYTQANSSSYKQAPQGAAMTDINHTFGQHNGTTGQGQNNWQAGATLQVPFRPLAHLDRIPLTPTELMHVVATQPHEFTRYFAIPPTDPNNGLHPNGRLKYTADWLDHNPAGGQAGFLYRALGLLHTGNHIHGLGMGGRIPGKININTIFNRDVFEAVVDSQQSNRFSSDPNNVMTAWNTLTSTRHLTPGQISQGDRPFRGNALAVDMTNNRNRTVLAPDMFWSLSDPTKSRENFTPGPAPGGHAADLEKYEMLHKVNNQFTTRSNTFAVYMTIGYFEVRNPGPYNEANRPVLGKELGIDEGKVERNKFFAIIDRTNLTIEQPTQLVAPGQAVTIRQGQPPVYFSYQPNLPSPSPVNSFQFAGTEDPIPDGVTQVQLRIPAMGQDAANGILGIYDGYSWTIRPGLSQVELDVGDRKETLLVTGATYETASSTAIITIQPITKPHSRGSIVRLANPDPLQPPSVPGNPGPQPGFSFKSPRYAPIVKYVEQIK